MDSSERELQRVRDRELELKRITGEISCAECRRLKLKCDRKVPCGSCVRRGHKQICPTGTSTGSSGRRTGARLVSDRDSSSSVDIPDKLAAMSERIRALEDALQIATDAAHPLLSPELLSIKRTPDVINRNDREKLEDVKTEDEELENAFGTLTIGEGKAMQFWGATASENLLLIDAFHNGSMSSCSDFSELPVELAQLSEMWPFAPAHLSHRSKLNQLGIFLPPKGRAEELLAAFFSRPAWVMQPSQADELVQLFYPNGNSIPPALLKPEHMHDLALFFMVLAGGVMAKDPYTLLSPEAERYQHLARTALSLNSIIEHGSLSACQALVLLGSYEVLVGRKASLESAWQLGSIGMVHAASIGLHRDPSHWNLESDTADRRRWVFWELYTIDKWKSLGTGRPSLFSARVVDCKFPDDTGMELDDGTKVESVGRWKYRFARDVLTRLAEQFSSARPPRYWEITALDRLVRDFDVHPFANRSLDPHFTVEQLSLHPFFSVWWKERALLYVHRNYFARAILEHADDPIHSPYAVSFLAAIRSASTMLKSARIVFGFKGFALKFNAQFWAMAISAALIIGSVAARTSSSFAASALEELEQTILLFKKSSHPVAKHGLALLVKLRDKAVSASNSPLHEDSLSPSISTTPALTTPDFLDAGSDEDEELHVMRGTTRRIERPSTPRASFQNSSASSLGQSSFAPSSLNGALSNAGSSAGKTTSTSQDGRGSSILFTGRVDAAVPSFIHGSPSQSAFHKASTPAGGAAWRDPETLRAWMPATEDNGLSSFLTQLGISQQQQQQQTWGQSASDLQQQPPGSGMWTSLNDISPLDSAFEDILKSTYTNEAFLFPSFSVPSGKAATAGYSTYTYPAASTNGADTSALQSTPYDINAEGNSEGCTASHDEWQSFIQQFSFREEGDTGLESWDAMELA